MAEITWSAISLAFGMMPTAQQDVLRNSSIEVCIFKKSEYKLYEASLASKVALLVGDKMKLTETMGSVPKKYGNFDWIRNKNGTSDRLERLGCFINTAHALAGGGYSLPSGEAVPLDSRTTAQSTEVVDAAAFLAGQPGRGVKSLRHDDLTVMEVAMKMQASGKATVAVNAASAYQVGGGVMSGGRHALEEAMCTTSTLLPSLQKVQWQDRRSTSHAHEHLHQHIPVTSCIMSPQVQIFRDTSARGYAFQERPTTLAGVCSIAMFNMNSRVADSPLDAPHDFAEYCHQVKDKFRATLACLQKLKASVLVCPDVGCGVFENDPEVVGCLLGEAILEYPGDLEVVTTGKGAFFRALKATVEADPPHPLKETASPPESFLRSLPKPKAKAKGKPHGAPPTIYGSAVAGAPVRMFWSSAPLLSAAVRNLRRQRRRLRRPRLARAAPSRVPTWRGGGVLSVRLRSPQIPRRRPFCRRLVCGRTMREAAFGVWVCRAYSARQEAAPAAAQAAHPKAKAWLVNRDGRVPLHMLSGICC